jgi:hypothetical protein
MRSPWKIIADIAGRRKSDETADLPVAIHERHNDESSASLVADHNSDVADKPVAHEVVVEDKAPTTAGENQVAEPDDRYVPTTAIVQSASSDEIQSIDTDTIEPLKVASNKTVAHSKPEQAEASKKTISRPAARRSNSDSSVEPNVIDDPLALENQISSLRSQLAGKLVLQNEYLRSLLERYH